MDSGRTNTVLKYNSRNLNIEPLEMESMLHERYRHACAIFSSGLNDGRPVIIIAGGTGSGPQTAEIYDFTSFQIPPFVCIYYITYYGNIMCIIES